MRQSTCCDFAASEEPTIVRVHSGCITGEVFHDVHCDCSWQLHHALELIAKSSLGVLVYLPTHEGRGNGLLEKIKSFRLIDEGLTTAQAFTALGIPLDTRDYSAALAVLHRLGVRRMNLITNNPEKLNAARQSGLEVVSRIPSVVPTKDRILLEYLEGKKRDFGHLI
jgi:GTP cyclohydrolase II